MRSHDLEGGSDEALVRSFVDDKDTDALEVLLRRHQARVYGLAFRILGNRSDALDVTQDVFLTLFRKAAAYKHEASFTTWLYRLVHNAAHDQLRRRQRWAEPAEVVDSAVKDRSGQVVDSIVVENALRELVEEQRTAIVLRDIYGCGYEEIASITGVPVGTIKSRIARGRMALAEKLKEPWTDATRLNQVDP